MTKRRAMLAASVMMVAMIVPARSDVFYDARLKEGKAALESNRATEAVDHLRIACFGLLDNPKALSEAMAWLAVAQHTAGRSADVEVTLNRFVDVESRFKSYDGAALDPKIRSQFESILVKQVAKQTLASIPTLAVMVQPKGQPVRPSSASAPATAVPASSISTSVQQLPTSAVAVGTNGGDSNEPATKPDPQPASPEPGKPAEKPVAPVAKTSVPSAATEAAKNTAPVTDGSVAAAIAPSAKASTEKSGATDPLEESRRFIAAGKPADAVALLVPALIKEPQRRDLRLMALQAACLASNWSVGAAQLSALKPFRDSEPVYMFYGAVVLFEMRRGLEARELMERALPRIVRSAYVDYYVKKILPARAAP